MNLDQICMVDLDSPEGPTRIVYVDFRGSLRPAFRIPLRKVRQFVQSGIGVEYPVYCGYGQDIWFTHTNLVMSGTSDGVGEVMAKWGANFSPAKKEERSKTASEDLLNMCVSGGLCRSK